jgi:hypothetical protein
MVAASTRAASAVRQDFAPPAPAPGEAQLRLLLASGGDERLALDPVTRRNRYGAPAVPAPDELWFSSSTACAVSPRGWSAAGEVLARLITLDAGARLPIDAWLDDIRARIGSLYGAPGSEAVLSASGSEAEFLALLIALTLAGGPVVNIVVAPAETGSGVPAAAAGRHFLARASLGGPVGKGERLAGWESAQIDEQTLEIRHPDGRLRASAEVDAEAAERVDLAVAGGAFALLHVLDASKTGRMGVSREAAGRIAASHPGRVLVVVDACQLRCPAERLRADLESGLAVMLTGSKFAGGPSFCGALLLPAALVAELRIARPPAALDDYSARLDWPQALRPAFAASLRHPANLGLGLRWTAALAEIEAYQGIAPDVRDGLAAGFDRAVRARVDADPGLMLLDAGEPLGAPGLTPILHTGGADVRAVYEALQRPCMPGAPACHLGQPVAVGERTALRVCASMPMITDAAARGVAPLEADLDRLFATWAALRARG